MSYETLFILFVDLVVGVGIGFFARHFLALSKRNTIEHEVRLMTLKAEEETARARADSERIKFEAEKEVAELFQKAREEDRKRGEEVRLIQDRLDRREAYVGEREQSLNQAVLELKSKTEALIAEKQSVEQDKREAAESLARISGVSKEEALALLLAQTEKNAAEDLYVRTLKLQREGKEILEEKAKGILLSAIHRIGNSNVAENMVTTVTLPNDELKGKIIGKEGRNIKVFERLAGVELLVDESPGVIVISCFEPVRRQIARLALEKLIADGRIQPAKIEEYLEKSEKEIGQIMKKKGEEALYETGILNIDERLIPLIGRLYFRTSYGQNVLQHSIEMAHIAGILAYELGADVQVAKAGALLHDIGKAVSHEIQGTHVEIGKRILEKFGTDTRIIQAMQAHHEEYPYETVESIIVQVADALSGGRPGARRDTVENYLKRLTDLEHIALSFAGAEKVYAIQAGRELRVFVTPEVVSDVEAHNLARAIALRIEQELRFPGEIKVHVIRETRAIEFAR